MRRQRGRAVADRPQIPAGEQAERDCRGERVACADGILDLDFDPGVLGPVRRIVKHAAERSAGENNQSQGVARRDFLELCFVGKVGSAAKPGEHR